NADVVFAEDGSIIEVEIPNFVVLAISQTDPGMRGDTATGGTKPATLETGATVNVPLFLNEGDKVRVDTRKGIYLDRVRS
ncbi:MAG TPA: elongation factor P, partial [Candidatus Kapabacteria bacterium]|nr:elongation factor P [Candidatus Kapabacteria bacterium]